MKKSNNETNLHKALNACLNYQVHISLNSRVLQAQMIEMVDKSAIYFTTFIMMKEGSAN